MEEGKGEIYLASGRQYGNTLLGVRHQEKGMEGRVDLGYGTIG